MPPDQHQDHVSEEVLSLRLKALKSDLRLMIIASVALNQFLAKVELPSEVTAVAIAAAILAPAGKAMLAFFQQ
jgi:hypothetical protein